MLNLSLVQFMVILSIGKWEFNWKEGKAQVTWFLSLVSPASLDIFVILAGSAQSSGQFAGRNFSAEIRSHQGRKQTDQQKRDLQVVKVIVDEAYLTGVKSVLSWDLGIPREMLKKERWYFTHRCYFKQRLVNRVDDIVCTNFNLGIRSHYNLSTRGKKQKQLNIIFAPIISWYLNKIDQVFIEIGCTNVVHSSPLLCIRSCFFSN